MRFFLWHLSLILVWIIFDVSFLQILLPNLQVPITLLALIVSLGLVITIDRAIGMALMAAFLFDLVRAGMLTPFFLLALPLVFLTRFMAERFISDSQSRLRPQVLIYFAILIGVTGLSLAPQSAWWSDILVGIILFPAVYFSVAWLEARLVSSSMLEFRGLRTTRP